MAQKLYLFVANWKMNLTFSEEIDFVTSNYDDLIALAEQTKQHIILCPSFVSLQAISKIFSPTSIKTGAQTCSSHTHGAFTGQVSPESINAVGCSYSIIGHSETRTQTDDENEKVAQKCVHLIDYDVTPIICVGETKEEHQKNKTLDIIERQLAPLFEAICSQTIIHKYIKPIIAYEPTWSIGTGAIANEKHLEMVFAWLQKQTKQVCPKVTFKFLYGGSVDKKTIQILKKIPQIDGFLIGKASLDFQEFKKIVLSGV